MEGARQVGVEAALGGGDVVVECKAGVCDVRGEAVGWGWAGLGKVRWIGGRGWGWGD